MEIQQQQFYRFPGIAGHFLPPNSLVYIQKPLGIQLYNQKRVFRQQSQALIKLIQKSKQKQFQISAYIISNNFIQQWKQFVVYDMGSLHKPLQKSRFTPKTMNQDIILKNCSFNDGLIKQELMINSDWIIITEKCLQAFKIYQGYPIFRQIEIKDQKISFRKFQQIQILAITQQNKEYDLELQIKTIFLHQGQNQFHLFQRVFKKYDSLKQKQQVFCYKYPKIDVYDKIFQFAQQGSGQFDQYAQYLTKKSNKIQFSDIIKDQIKSQYVYVFYLQIISSFKQNLVIIDKKQKNKINKININKIDQKFLKIIHQEKQEQRKKKVIQPSISKQNVKTLIDIGFPQDRVIKALQKNNDNIELALNYLLSLIQASPEKKEKMLMIQQQKKQFENRQKQNLKFASQKPQKNDFEVQIQDSKITKKTLNYGSTQEVKYNQNQCKICLNKQSCMVNITCFHMCVCESCYASLYKTCPVCRSFGQFKKVLKM